MAYLDISCGSKESAVCRAKTQGRRCWTVRHMARRYGVILLLYGQGLIMIFEKAETSFMSEEWYGKRRRGRWVLCILSHILSLMANHKYLWNNQLPGNLSCHRWFTLLCFGLRMKIFGLST